MVTTNIDVKLPAIKLVLSNGEVIEDAFEAKFYQRFLWYNKDTNSVKFNGDHNSILSGIREEAHAGFLNTSCFPTRIYVNLNNVVKVHIEDDKLRLVDNNCCVYENSEYIGGQQFITVYEVNVSKDATLTRI